jgi:hypothetical protein
MRSELSQIRRKPQENQRLMSIHKHVKYTHELIGKLFHLQGPLYVPTQWINPLTPIPTSILKPESIIWQKNAGEATIVRDATIQAKADKAKADKAKADKADKAEADKAKAVNNGKDQDGAVTLVTREQKQEGLKMWKELLITTKDYQPFNQRTE